MKWQGTFDEFQLSLMEIMIFVISILKWLPKKPSLYYQKFKTFPQIILGNKDKYLALWPQNSPDKTLTLPQYRVRKLI